MEKTLELSQLSKTQRQVVLLNGKGRTIQYIAEKLGMAEGAMKKLRVLYLGQRRSNQ